MRVSEYYRLGKAQPALDFVDVDIFGDLRVFVDPRALRRLGTPWGNECVSLVQDFFGCVLTAIKEARHDDARSLLLALREPNEVHLGLSRSQARGRALGNESARDVWAVLRDSEAAKSGLLEDLEDTVLLVPGIAADIVSDITINIIRQALIAYTQEQCSFYEIPVVQDVDSGPLWDPSNHEWFSQLVTLPVTSEGRLILVPKSIVRRRLEYDADEYYRHYILEHLRDQELAAGTELVRLLKSGRRLVTKKSLIEKYGRGKGVILRQTAGNPAILDRYRNDKRSDPQLPLQHEELADIEGSDYVKWRTMFEEVVGIQPGREDADAYMKAVEALITALFYPSLSFPHREYRIHEGRKRIDISYTNLAEEGFFGWLGKHYPSSQIFVECKNYSEDPGNPELDQLSGRFSPRRGRVGLLVCRRIDDKDLIMRRCRDTASDDRGFIIPLDDNDLRDLVEERRQGLQDFGLLMLRFQQLL